MDPALKKKGLFTKPLMGSPNSWGSPPPRLEPHRGWNPLFQWPIFCYPPGEKHKGVKPNSPGFVMGSVI